MLIRHRLAAGAATAVLFGAIASAPIAHAQLQFTEGHLDVFTVTATGGALELSIKEDITGRSVIQKPEHVTLIVSDAAFSDATTQVPEIGVASYYLPQSQSAGKLWPGWDTFGVRPDYSTVDLHFDSVTGPGSVYIFESRGFDGVNPVTTNGSYAITAGSVIQQEKPAHRHVNWAFTKPGTYTMKVTAHAGNTQSNTATYTWQVGEASSLFDANQQQSQPTVHNSQQPQPRLIGQPQPATSAVAAAPAPVAPAPAGTGQCQPLVIPMIKDDSTVPATWKNFGELTFQLGAAAQKDLPKPIGPVPAGKVWMIGSIQEDNVPWVGSNNQHPTLLDHTQGPVTWELVGFKGPGPMVVYSQGGLGQVVGEQWFKGANNQAAGSHVIPRNSHVHPNWVFGAPGTYYVSIRQTVTLTNGTTAQATGTLTFQVGQGSQSGHFDIGAAIDPAGTACDPGLAAAQSLPDQPQTPVTGEVPDAVETQQAASQPAAVKVEETSWKQQLFSILPIGFMALGMFVLGAGVMAVRQALRGKAAS